jgi:hypothetical protein
VPADADRARRAAEEILARPEYQEPAKAWWESVLEWVDDLFSELHSLLAGSGGGTIIGWIVVLLVLSALAFVIWRAVRGGLRRAPSGPQAVVVAAEPFVDWAAEAARLEAEGDWRGGLRARYRALVADLAARRALDPAVARTTGDHRHEVARALPDRAGDFDAAAELFERAWYGGRPTGPAEADRFGDLSRQVRRGAR